MSRYRTRAGIVLRRHATPAGDLILTVLAPDGKLRAIARGGARGKRAPRLNLFQHIVFQTYERPGNDLPTLTQVGLEGALPTLVEPARYPYAHLLAELADRLWQENDHVGQAGFELLSGGLRGIAHHGDPDRVALVIAWKLLALHGLSPRVRRCAETGDTTRLTHFDAPAGRVTAARVARGLPVGEAAVDELGFIQRGTVREALADPLEPEAREGLWRALEGYARHHVGELQVWGAVRTVRADAEFLVAAD